MTQYPGVLISTLVATERHPAKEELCSLPSSPPPPTPSDLAARSLKKGGESGPPLARGREQGSVRVRQRPRETLTWEEGPAGVRRRRVSAALRAQTFACLKARASLCARAWLSDSRRPPCTAPPPHYLYRLGSCLPVPISSGSRECGANRMLFLEREVGSLADTLTTCSWPCGIRLFVPHDPRFQSVQSPCTL